MDETLNVSKSNGFDRLFHQCYHQPIGNLGMERIVTLKMTVVIGVRVGTNLSSHRGVSSYFSTFQVRDDLSMNRGGTLT